MLYYYQMMQKNGRFFAATNLLLSGVHPMKTSVILAASTTLLPLSAIAAETISCDALPTCAELGYTETVAQCPGKYLVCPFDRTLGTCIHDAKVGQIGYFTKDPGNCENSIKTAAELVKRLKS